MKRALPLLCLLLGLSVAAAEPPFAYPQPGHAFTFPRDYGSHPDFKIEWWYLTGHLWSEGAKARRFGFQATFFRQAGDHPGAPDTEPAGDFAPAPFYLAHMALLDVEQKRFLF
jgi:predicted secreted hydrolase